MKRWPAMISMLSVVGIALSLAACGGQADENKPMSEVQEEAQSMDAGQLRDMALAYKNAIQAKAGDIDDLTAQIKKIPPLELMGEEAKQLKQEVDTITQSVDALKDRFKVYYDKLKEMDGDLSGLDL